jgi:hypothetical protein
MRRIGQKEHYLEMRELDRERIIWVRELLASQLPPSDG